MSPTPQSRFSRLYNGSTCSSCFERAVSKLSSNLVCWAPLGPALSLFPYTPPDEKGHLLCPDFPGEESSLQVLFRQ
jgi:hypothetical protein